MIGPFEAKFGIKRPDNELGRQYEEIRTYIDSSIPDDSTPEWAKGAEIDRLRSAIEPAPNVKWSREEDDLLNQLMNQKVPFLDISTTMTERFGAKRKVNSVTASYRDLHKHDNTDKPKQVHDPWTPEQVDWLHRRRIQG